MQAIRLKNLEPPKVAAGGMLLDWAGIIHHRTYNDKKYINKKERE
jgi:hypothetical protein